MTVCCYLREKNTHFNGDNSQPINPTDAQLIYAKPKATISSIDNARIGDFLNEI